MQRHFEVDPDEYPFESHWYEGKRATLHYLDEGEGHPVVMLHGNPSWSYLYRKVIRELQGKCRAIAPDYPGFGFSPHPEHYGYTPAEHALVVGELVDHLGLERFSLLLQDWGGPIGIGIAVERCERVAGLVIGNTWCWRPSLPMSLFSYALGNPLGRHFIRTRNLFADAMMKGALEQSGTPSESTLAAYRDPFPTPASRIGTWVFPKEITGSKRWLADLEMHLEVLRERPVELLWGERDPIFRNPVFETRWREHFPHAHSERIADAGHFFQEDRPDRIAAGVIRLLDRIANPEPLA